MPVYWEENNYFAKAREYPGLEQTLFSFQDVFPALEVKCLFEKPMVHFSRGPRH